MISFDCSSNPFGSRCYFPHFTDVETEAWRGWGSYSRSHGFRPTCPDSKFNVFPTEADPVTSVMWMGCPPAENVGGQPTLVDSIWKVLPSLGNFLTNSPNYLTGRRFFSKEYGPPSHSWLSCWEVRSWFSCLTYPPTSLTPDTVSQLPSAAKNGSDNSNFLLWE